MVEIKTSAEVQAMRGAGQVVAEILATVQDQAKAGMRTAELDEVARDVLARHGAYSPFLNYQPGFAPVPFPATICTSVNDAALHGIISFVYNTALVALMVNIAASAISG